MTREELIKIGKREVRNSASLLEAYKVAYKELFGHIPPCTGCTFDSDWNEFVNANENNIKTMENKTFKLFDNSIIYTYHEKNKSGNKIPVRTFGYLMTEDFALNYLTKGTPEQIEERKQQFKILPEFPSEETKQDLEEKENLNPKQETEGDLETLDEGENTADNKQETEQDLDALKVAELKKLALEKGLKEEDLKGLKKSDLILLIKSN
ncbi:hypothetical protein NNL19_02890 [Riemerella anatipestifer]|uniref:hypothetical protein n=1 Tax=Riemerella anatipestifer TaxID=34085 RepID=UPI0012AE4C0F|nr:hypothetical protein [Riemerella anatipestifer]MCQ4154545.1 hypothetical protein [Riemerella anatipestifer]MCQ4180538.1 hypothetical protein [Riemerella anatipestifer]MDR7693208.1 hypothetical protein [Riemerella anatipestifer]MDR7793414.1 hypothetical protein [Riemerella anatipestifer]MRQ21843.1 hypothetical protein [Riemerella anatipestifer]